MSIHLLSIKIGLSTKIGLAIVIKLHSKQTNRTCQMPKWHADRSGEANQTFMLGIIL
jgi:hypothetical protein